VLGELYAPRYLFALSAAYVRSGDREKGLFYGQQAKQKAEAEAQQKAAAEAQRKAAAEAQQKAAAEAQQKAAAEAKQKAEAEAKQQVEAEAAAQKSAEAAETALRLAPADRQRIQVALTSLGFDTHGADGVFGPR
jgi:ATPase subunit of ABC transporter with duplicated ATPase domains